MASLMVATSPGDARWAGELALRAVTALVLIPAVVWVVVWAPWWVFDALVLLLAGVAAWELNRIFERAGRATHRRLGVMAVVVVTASFAVPGASVPALTLAIATVLSMPLWVRRPPSSEPANVALLGLTYVGWLLGHGLLLHRLPEGPSLILLLVGVTWIGESVAYAVGSTIGRYRLAVEISPRKTVEGAVAQLAVSLAAAVVLAGWLLPTWPLAATLGVGALLGTVAQIGDLAESAIKRSVGAKDTGGLVPGHGGVLDRIDSLLFTTPVLFYAVTWTGLAS